MHTKTKTYIEPPQTMGVHKTINKKQQNHRLIRTNSNLSYRGGGGGGGLTAFYWRQIFALDSVFVNTQKLLARVKAS